MTDILNEYVKILREPNVERKVEIAKKIESEIWPTNLKIIEERLVKNNGWLVSSGMTWADLYLNVVLESLGDKKNAALAPYPHCKALADKVTSNPKIAEWIKNRPETPY